MKNNNKERLDVVFILDNSGSMGGSENNTITSYNEYLERERKKKYNVNITTVLFNDHFKYLYKRNSINNVKKLTREEYVVGGCTALYDALGTSINYIDSCDTDKVLFIIITDGYENASTEFNKSKIKRLINKHKDWEFIYIGADIDSYACGSAIGIKSDNIANFKKDRKATNLVFESVSAFGDCMMDACCAERNWKEELDNYIESNKKKS